MLWKRVLLVGLVASFGLLLVGGVPGDVDTGVVDTSADAGVVATDDVPCDATCVDTETPIDCNDPDPLGCTVEENDADSTVV